MIMYWYHFIFIVVTVVSLFILPFLLTKVYFKKFSTSWILVLARDCFLQITSTIFFSSYATIITINSFTTPFLLSGEMVFFCFFLCVLFGTVCFLNQKNWRQQTLAPSNYWKVTFFFRNATFCLQLIFSVLRQLSNLFF